MHVMSHFLKIRLFNLNNKLENDLLYITDRKMHDQSIAKKFRRNLMIVWRGGRVGNIQWGGSGSTTIIMY